MYYIIQNNLYPEYDFYNLINSLNMLNYEYELVDLLPFVDTIDFKTKRKDVFCFGALKMAKISKQYNWNPGCIMTKNHDFNIYKNFYKENLLNYDSKIFNFNEEFDFNEKLLFIRPTEDTKLFDGKIFNYQQWKELKEFILTNGYIQSLNENTKILVNTIKNIKKEFRFFIVNGEIVTGSLYKLNGKFFVNDIIDDGAIKFCKQMLDIYKLADSFIMDIGFINNEWKIIECGCINCAGFYKIDINKLLMFLENFYNRI